MLMVVDREEQDGKEKEGEGEDIRRRLVCGSQLGPPEGAKVKSHKAWDYYSCLTPSNLKHRGVIGNRGRRLGDAAGDRLGVRRDRRRNGIAGGKKAITAAVFMNSRFTRKGDAQN